MGRRNQTVTQKAEPWRPTQPALEGAIGTLGDMFGRGAMTSQPYEGARVAGFGGDSLTSQGMIRNLASGPSVSGEASGFLSRMMDPNYQSDMLEQVKRNALGTAIPAATSMFSGSGMTNSSGAMDFVGRAATEAVAPFEFDAFNRSMDRGMTAAGMAPGIERATYLPATMLGTVGASQDAMSQARIDADMARHYETQGLERQNFENYLSNLLRISGQGGSQSTTQPGPSTMQSLASGGLTGIGTYGALAGIPAAGPFAIPLGIAAGLAGMF